MDFLDCCRLCRTSSSDSNLLHLTSSINGIEISEILTQTIPIDFNDEISSILPQKVCHKCFDIFMSAYELQKIAIESDKFYRASVIDEQLGKIKSESLVEVKIECEDFDEIFIPSPSPARRRINDIGSFEDFEEKSNPQKHPAGSSRRRKTKHVPYEQPFEYFDDDSQQHPAGSFEDTDKNYENPFRPRKSSKSDLEEIFYDCSFCDMSDKRKIILDHMKIHNPQIYPFACVKCTKRFEYKVELESHLESLHEDCEDIFECDRCGATGSSKIGMENHITFDHVNPEMRSKKIIHIKPLDLKCGICDSDFERQQDSDEHFMRVHERLIRRLEPDEVTFNLKCCMCEKDHKNRDQLLRHIKVHSKKFRRFRCKLCNNVQDKFYEFSKHSEYHSQPTSHKCLTCDVNSFFGTTFIRHIRAHRNNKEVRVKCPDCGLLMKSKQLFENHYRIKHKKETLFICPICATSMTSNSSLDQHIKFVHDKEKSRKFQCKICPMKFAVKNKLARHEATHSTERPHVCDVCAKTFKHIETFRFHMKRHDGTMTKNHVCSQCSKAFHTKNMLELHMLSHSGLKPEQCQYCDRSYALKGDLVKHMRKMHIGDAVYKCKKCPKAFRLIVELREHQTDHQND